MLCSCHDKFHPTRLSGPDPGFSVGGGGVGPFWGGFGLQHGHFSVKMYVKTKELGPVGGGVHQHTRPQICLWLYTPNMYRFSR